MYFSLAVLWIRGVDDLAAEHEMPGLAPGSTPRDEV